MMIEFGSIVRLERKVGLIGMFEVCSDYNDNFVMITNDECNSEMVIPTEYVILVCKPGNRLDLE